MKLGTETGSLMNHLMAASDSDKPEVGMAATILGWTDRYAGTVIWVSPSGKSILVQEDSAVRTDKNGASESQTYEYSRNPDGRVFEFRLGARGQWVCKGYGLLLGARQHYQDPCF